MESDSPRGCQDPRWRKGQHELVARVQDPAEEHHRLEDYCNQSPCSQKKPDQVSNTC